uniref:RNase H type-1 domain-containing protein n=1 Tax=Cannabis sativa TaxID=3483 RepID=A0A803Q9X7_CANSA
MPIAECHERYLGFPAYVGRDKKEMFSEVKEKIWQKLHAWNEKLFSIGGKEALLAKHAWRIYEMPNSLLSRLLKHRYFSNNSFLEASLGHSPSMTWQGIHWGRELLPKGLRFKIRNGHNVLAGLITETREWNLTLLHQYFKSIDIEKIVSIPLSNYLDKYKRATDGNKHPSLQISSSNANNQHTANASLPAQHNFGATWRPPDLLGMKLNVDAAVNSVNKVLGIGAIVRNHQGKVIAALSKPVQGCFRSDEMEAKTLFHSINWAIQLQLIPITHIETDALRVSSALNSTSIDLSSFSDLIIDVRCLLSSFSRVIVSHVKRNTNHAAHGLAKYALELDEDDFGKDQRGDQLREQAATMEAEYDNNNINTTNPNLYAKVIEPIWLFLSGTFINRQRKVNQTLESTPEQQQNVVHYNDCNPADDQVIAIHELGVIPSSVQSTTSPPPPPETEPATKSSRSFLSCTMAKDLDGNGKKEKEEAATRASFINQEWPKFMLGIAVTLLISLMMLHFSHPEIYDLKKTKPLIMFIGMSFAALWIAILLGGLPLSYYLLIIRNIGHSLIFGAFYGIIAIFLWHDPNLFIAPIVTFVVSVAHDTFKFFKF